MAVVEAGASVAQYWTMDSLEVAYTILGYRQRLREQYKIARQIGYWSLIPYAKKNEQFTPLSLGMLPGEKEAQPRTTLEDVRRMREYYGD